MTAQTVTQAVAKRDDSAGSVVAKYAGDFARVLPSHIKPDTWVRLTQGALRKGKRIEVRFPDPSCNPYLAFSAMMLAGLDGIQNKIDPGDPLDKDIYALSPEELKNVPHMPGGLDEALDAMEKDHDYLLRGDVFTKDAIFEWLDYKRSKELNPIRMRPTPHEFYLYFDI